MSRNKFIESQKRQNWATFFYSFGFSSYIEYMKTKQKTKIESNIKSIIYWWNVTGTFSKVTIPRIIANKQHRSIGGYVCCKNKIEFSYLLTVFFAILNNNKKYIVGNINCNFILWKCKRNTVIKSLSKWFVKMFSIYTVYIVFDKSNFSKKCCVLVAFYLNFLTK